MANNLPDEIVSEILSPALKVSDDAFSDTSRNSPFALYSESSSAFLLVSKAWLRVATPLLYHVVVLRSKAQAAALDSALRDNKELGRFIKKLRVEGGYGGSMFKIIKAAPNITDIFISLNIWSDDNVGGLIRGLPLINPTRVVLHDTEGTRNKNIHLLHDAVTQCIKGWKNLTVFEIPYSNNNYYHSREASEAIGSALKEAPNLKTVIIPAIPVTRTIPHYLVSIAQNPSVRSIQFKETSNFKVPDYFYRGYNAPALADPSLRGLIKAPVDISNDDSMNFPSASPSPQPTPQPLQFSTASVTEDIWERIISFAAVLTFNNDRTRSKPRLGIVLVSKMFARLALPYFYEAIILRTPWQFDDLMVHLNADPILCSRVRTLYLSTNAHINLRPALPRIRLLNLIGQAPFGMTCKAFSDLGKHSGPTLVRLEGIHVAKGSTVQNPSVFSSFHHLRSLSIGFKGSFDMKSSSIPVGALANLEELSLSAMDGSLLTVLTEMDLVALRHVAFSVHSSNIVSFLAKHGSKIRTLEVYFMTLNVTNVFDRCPAMVDLTVYCGPTPPNGAHLTSSVDHTSFERLILKANGRQRKAEQKWKPFFTSFSVATFPALRQVTFPYIRWPTSEHEIGKSNWVRVAERLLDHGVKLTDESGVGWRRRLKK